jgi:hypothetical protein
MLASDIISRVRLVLNDNDGVRWLNAELFQWITDSQLLIALVRPDAVNATVNHPLVAGTRQTIPSDGLRLLDLKRNLLNAEGAAGPAIRIVEQSDLDLFNPAWHQAVAQTTVKNYVYDNRDVLAFYVYPPAKVGARVELLYSKNPGVIDSLSDALAVQDIYQEVVVNYVLFRAYAKDAAFANNAQLMTGYLQIINGLLGVKLTKDVAFSPKMYNKGVAPTASASVGGV